MYTYQLLIKSCLASLIAANIFGQVKKPIDTEAYFLWKSVEHPVISDNGNIVVYHESMLRGNTRLVLHNSKTSKTAFFARGKQGQIHPGESLVVFKITPDYDSIRQLKLAQIPEKKHPKDSLGIYLVHQDSLIKLPKVQSYKFAKESLKDDHPWVIIHHFEDYKATAKTPAQKNTKPSNKKKCDWFNSSPKTVEIKDKFPKPSGQVMTLFNGQTLEKIQISGVKEFELNYFGTHVVFTECLKYADTLDSCHLYRYSLAHLKKEKIASIKGEITQLAINKNASTVSYMASADTGSYKNYQLYLWSVDSLKPYLIIDTLKHGFKPHQLLSKSAKPYFSENGNQLFFGIGNKVKAPAKDTLTKEEKYSVDIWHWNDARIQPQQLYHLKKEEQGFERWVYHLDNKKMIQLTDTSLVNIIFSQPNNAQFGLLSSQVNYFKKLTYDTWYYDYFKVDLTTGTRQLLLSHYPGSQVYLSPLGQQCVYWDFTSQQWKKITTTTDQHNFVHQGIKEEFSEKYHDTPDLTGAIGKIYWITEKEFLVESQQNIWIISDNNEPRSLTKNANPDVHYTVLTLDKDSAYVNLSDIYFKSFNYRTKEEGLWRLDGTALKPLFVDPKHIVQLNKASHSTNFIIRQSTIEEFPDVQIMDSNGVRKLITTTNPQQKEYNWASVSLASWVSYAGDSLSGLLYKPSDYDSSKTYPLLVYYYERYTDNMHRHYAPRPTASIIFATEYCSNGYLVFMPDIPYIIGKPAQSAYAAVMSGVDHLLSIYPNIDSTRMGLQGQSWGGYQTAQLITMTTRFKCAMAGAPVSNMFSAYGGIRWGSGLSRSFQYEKGQSRIGKTIWEAPELYFENSPLFHLPKVQTPLLIMHNDKDGAVPWYQGIELYNGLRRLDKPVWLLNYNDDDHNLMKTANRIDLSIRMRGFFDHYLLNSPAPLWMEQGIPALNKGSYHGY
jgi:dipeptidyl aminopeptidase/acylaminoacyl peptidase